MDRGAQKATVHHKSRTQFVTKPPPHKIIILF